MAQRPLACTHHPARRRGREHLLRETPAYNNQTAPARTTPVGGGKVGIYVMGLTKIAEAYAKIKLHFMNEEKDDASTQFQEYGWRVLARIQYSIQQKLIPEKYLQPGKITDIANYFLTGSNAEGVDQNFLYDLWEKTDNLYYETKKLVPKVVGNGNNGNTGAKPVEKKEEVVEIKKI